MCSQGDGESNETCVVTRSWSVAVRRRHDERRMGTWGVVEETGNEGAVDEWDVVGRCRDD